MARARRRKTLTVAMLAWAAPMVVSGQSDSELIDQLRACLGVEPDAARLACFESRLTSVPEAPAAPDAPPVEIEAEVIEQPDAPPAPPIESVAALPEASAAPLAAARAPAVEPDAARSVARSDEPSDHERSGLFGRSELAGETIRIVEVRVLRPGEARFVAADGRVFTQTSAGRVRYPSAPFDAQLEGGTLGSLFLRLVEDGPRVRVTLLR